MENWREVKDRTPSYILRQDKEKNDKWNLGITNQEFFKNEDGKRDPYKDGLSYWWKEEN